MRILSNSKNIFEGTSREGGKLLGKGVPLYQLHHAEEEAEKRSHVKISNPTVNSIKVEGCGYHFELQGKQHYVISKAQFEALKDQMTLERLVKSGLKFDNCDNDGN